MNRRLRITFAGWLCVAGACVTPGGADERGRLPKLETDPVALNVVFGLDPGKGKYDGVVGRPTDTWNLLDVGSVKACNM